VLLRRLGIRNGGVALSGDGEHSGVGFSLSLVLRFEAERLAALSKLLLKGTLLGFQASPLLLELSLLLLADTRLNVHELRPSDWGVAERAPVRCNYGNLGNR
jgi:hypothetical protein